MEFDKYIQVTCPYCGVTFGLSASWMKHLDVQDGKPFAVICDNEDVVNCGRQFIARVDLHPVVETATIEWKKA